MEDKLTLTLIYTGIISALVAMLLTMGVFCVTVQKQAHTALVNAAAEISAFYEENGDADALAALDNDAHRLTLIAADNTKLYGTDESISDIDAQSGTFTNNGGRTNDAYTATLGDGSLLIVTAAIPGLFTALSGSYGALLICFLCIVVLCVVSALLLSRRFIKPIKALPDRLDKPGFDPEGADIYPELRPMLEEINTRRNEREEMRQEFTANVSHELKTPLTTISGYSEMIATGLVKAEDIPRFAKKIHAESERMQTLVGDIIELNALDSQSANQLDEQVSVLALVQDCVEQLSPHFAAKKLSVSIVGDDFIVQGSRRQLWELVYNLLDNARRYNVDNGMIQITLNDRTLAVKDTGIGIAKEYQSRVFERFYRVDKSHSRATGGTGLGLSIVKHVAELHGASIELDSAEHIGTEIRVHFPS
jgi:two-component system, OmpR family, phosphate regulon sensor histidine kinase PhoR